MTFVDLLFIGLLGYLCYWLIDSYHMQIAMFTKEYNEYILYSFIINFIVYRYFIQFILFNMLYSESISKVDRNVVRHYNIGIFGYIGSRKSANGTALTQMSEGIIIGNMEERLYKLNLLMIKYLDFEDFNDFIFDKFDFSNVHTELMYKMFAYYYIKTKQISLINFNNKLNDTSFSEESIVVLLGEYVELMYYKYFRDNNIQSNTSIHSINTGKMSLPMKESTFQFFRSNNRAYEKYLITFKDEAAIVDNSRTNSNNSKEAREENDDGKDVENVLQRHGGKGTTLRFTIAQSEKDVTANRRRLFNRSIELYEPKDQFLFNFEMNVIKWFAYRLMKKESKKFRKKMKKVKRAAWIYRLTGIKRYIQKSERIYNKYEHYLVRFNLYKRILLVLEKTHIFLGKSLYCVQYMFLHDDSNNIGKNPTALIESGKSIPMFIVYPAGITFGKYATHSYFRLFDERNASASVPLAMVKPFKKLTMSKEEHLSMGFKAIERITEKMDSLDNTNTQNLTNDYSAFD